MGEIKPTTDATAYAHTLPPPATMADWEPLEVHAAEVAALAARFASAFGAADWGELLGQWHDLGKLSKAFSGLSPQVERR